MDYKPSLTNGARVRLAKESHQQFSKTATVLLALPNPSRHKEHQWYDVRFDDGILGRFLERYLDPIEDRKTTDAA